MQDDFINYSQLRERGVRFSRLQLNRLIAAGLFPGAVWQSPRRKVWRVSDVERWKENLPSERPSLRREDKDAAACA